MNCFINFNYTRQNLNTFEFRVKLSQKAKREGRETKNIGAAETG